MSKDNKVIRVQVNLTPGEFDQLEQLVAERRGRMSRSAVMADALEFYVAYRAQFREQRDYRRAQNEQPDENAPETPQDGPGRACHLREV